jgi:hypothetical protein
LLEISVADPDPNPDPFEKLCSVHVPSKRNKQKNIFLN